MPRINVNAQIYISDITPEDEQSYIECMKDREIYENTVTVPYPYGENEAKWWIAAVNEEARRYGVPLQYAIRKDDGELIGGIGFMKMKNIKDHSAELGYWLSKGYRNKGIMTNCVKTFCHYAFFESEFDLVRIQCRVFAHNDASVRVLEKAKFQPEGYMRKRFFKDEKYFDAKIFALVR